MSKTFQKVINENPAESLDKRNLLIIIATDGEPTDDAGYSNIPEFKQTLMNCPSFVFTNIVACTDDERSIGYLNGLDRELARLDVVDDYASELAEIRRLNGPDFKFSFGDYATKALLGSVNPDLDLTDESVSQPQTIVVSKPKKEKFYSKFLILSPDYSTDYMLHLQIKDILLCQRSIDSIRL